MRDLSSELRARLDGGVTTLCNCWIVRRRDGRALGFTDHDGDLTIDGIVCRAAAGMDASAVETSLGLGVDNGEALGALGGADLTEADLVAGRYDGAEVYHWLVDWRAPSTRFLKRRAAVGEVSREALAFRAELRGLAHRLDQTVGRTYQRGCDVELGSAACGVDLGAGGRARDGVVGRLRSARAFDAPALADVEAGWFAVGALTWTSGANQGLVSEIRSHSAVAGAAAIELWRTPPAAIALGDAFRAIAGCDKRFATCAGKFANASRFRGFPHLPGENWLLAHPRDGAVHDGGPWTS